MSDDLMDKVQAARRRITQPGPADPVRIESFEGRAVRVEFELEPGLSLRDAIARPLASVGMSSAGVTLVGTKLRPFRYVLPTFSKSPDHVAYYSETHSAVEEVEIDYANATFGSRDAERFIHCHALWRDGRSRIRGGHILPLETMVSAPGRAVAVGLTNVAMDAEFDPETNFTLFRPKLLEKADPGSDSKCVVSRIRPNEDFIEAIERICHTHSLRKATVRSGVGSIVGAEFDDGRRIHEVPTEIAVLRGRIAPDDTGAPAADVEIAVIDAAGNIHEGRPARGKNSVLICTELVLQADED